MKKIVTLVCLLIGFTAFSQEEGRTVISLNGQWEFDQTEKAFPPQKFTRKIPVPGLIHLAVPKVSQYDRFFKKPTEPELSEQFNFLDRDYTPMYNWYRKKITIDRNLSGRKLTLTIKKSQYVTQVYVNGISVGRSIECYTPIDFNITEFVKFGAENELLIQVGDRAWLPSEAAGSTDKEKVNYLPGIWDDVFIAATGNLKVDRALFLPSLKKEQVTVKVLLHNLYPPQMLYGAPMYDDCRIEVTLKEKRSGKAVAAGTVQGDAKRDNHTCFETTLDLKHPQAWSPENPFLYEGEINVFEKDRLADRYTVSFGMRDFSVQGKYFTLNGSKYFLRGSNITLQRFFEDPDCGNLAWDREWVKKLMIDLPKSIDWNAMRICVGIVPDFWYDLCDEYGIVLQNEWFYWQIHGWDDQVRKEYTDWVWSDGNHPSIVIWDAINENRDDYTGNVLIPELKKLDPTRVWDAGYMSDGDMDNDEMDEPHPYTTYQDVAESSKKNPYSLGDLQNWDRFRSIPDAGVPQLANEYGWIWLWRNGKPSKLTVKNYDYYVG
jgi:beta-galactosidase/beta-glucuronidase